ncbi:ubiquitin-conjugating enzyme E2 J1 [Histomonas meleagridis]|uniref:ubiquitin-conjugating enzyme E2 J1 n=1 Tax=Histomonas meleagridis TaxID=135588 RepID=UPI003559D2A7|nr:ubiquitin-conjugating enzyme E2 J1 [Histomonas meleagridis]KAH0802863.1 ubiquitin-conjugating enzyme E2 J1 [Histomonas meleagridis]
MSLNSSSPAVKRLMGEYQRLQKNPESSFVAAPLDEDIFIWHFTIKGPPDTPFQGGIYHGKIIFPQQYPYKPPDIYFLTPNGRFETNKKICLSITSFHPDTWNPSWDVRTALTSIIAFMPTKGEGAVGAIDTSPQERRALAIDSRNWHCHQCNLSIEPDDFPTSETNSEIPNESNKETENIEEEKHEVEQEEKPDTDDEHPIPKVEEEDQIDEKKVDDGFEHYNFDQLKPVPLAKKPSFIPLLDIPILILFAMLIFLITNSVFGFVKIFE